MLAGAVVAVLPVMDLYTDGLDGVGRLRYVISGRVMVG